MAKEKEIRYSGNMESEKNIFQGKIPENDVQITFRGNRKFDLQIGRNTITFRGRESKIIPASYLKTKDWKQQSSKFIVREVNNG